MNPSNELTLKPVNDLLEQSFFIPSYQRGYRWTKRQVCDLLDDVYEFYNKEKDSKNEFYCLQPIVVRERDDQWELVDGQQRLTTIYLILSYFNIRLAEEYRKKLYQLEYETRPGSKDYLNSIDNSRKSENIDYHHIYESFQHIKTWFSDKQNVAPDIESTFLNRVKVIWYEVKESIDPVTLFARLNVGKIPLTNSELVKALLLRSSNFSDGDPRAQQLSQLKIAHEWDDIERQLQDDAFWYFISGKAVETNRIEFVLKLVAGKLCNNPELKRDPAYTFLAFSQYFSENDVSAQDLWRRVKRYFMTLREWFDDRHLYHLVGFLVCQKESVGSIQSLSKTCTTKQEFRQALKSNILKKVFGDIDGASAERDEAFRDKLQETLKGYDYPSTKIRPALLLFNIAALMANSASNMRFQFDSYKKEDWDIEHVHSVESAMPERVDEQKKWLANILEYCTGKSEPEAQYAAISELDETDKGFCNQIKTLQDAKKFDSEAFKTLFKAISTHYDKDQNHEVDNSIGNLTLLDATTNRSYKNAIFPIKRKRIIQLDKSGTFVPLCTRNLFLKYYSDNVSQMMVWTRQDAKSYQSAMVETLVEFFSEQGVQ